LFSTATMGTAHGESVCSAVLRQSPEDFVVREDLGFELSGEGEHCWLEIEKKGLNTSDIVDQLARLAQVKAKVIGYAGLKDKYAITRQWFSLGLAGKSEPDWGLLNSDRITVLQVARHQRKLRRGVHSANRFKITLRSVVGDRDEIEVRLGAIKDGGIPNYFGEQRFGHEGKNINRAAAWFAGQSRAPRNRQKRGLYLSAARAYLFNLVLDNRVSQADWQLPLTGDVCILDGTRSYFTVKEADRDIAQRGEKFDIHLACPLWGGGRREAEEHVQRREDDVLAADLHLCLGLEEQGLNMEYRSARMVANDFSWQFFEDDSLQLKFVLAAGCFATSLVRELARY
jgi:tRNA pseudouridine13 synthase